MADPVTLAELNDALNLGGDSSHDDELEVYIAAVTAHVSANYGDLPTGTYTEIVNAFRDDDGVIRARIVHTPATSVTSLTDPDGTEYTTGITITADGYIEHDNLGTGRWTIEYESDFGTIPADLKLAALEDIRGLYQPGQIGPPAAFGAFGLESTEVGTNYRPVRLWPRVDAWIASRQGPLVA